MSKVKMPWAQLMKVTISWPSRWLSETGIVPKPSSSCSVSSTRMPRSAKLELRRMRGVEQAPMQQHQGADQAHHPGDAADHDRHDLLESVADADHVEQRDRRQQPDQMAEEDDQHADMEQHRAHHQLPAAQQLARSRAPSIGLPVVSDDRPDHHHRQCDIGKNPEEQCVEEARHGVPRQEGECR